MKIGDIIAVTGGRYYSGLYKKGSIGTIVDIHGLSIGAWVRFEGSKHESFILNHFLMDASQYPIRIIQMNLRKGSFVVYRARNPVIPFPRYVEEGATGRICKTRMNGYWVVFKGNPGPVFVLKENVIPIKKYAAISLAL